MRNAYWPVHFGKEYLAWSVRSVQDVVDELHIFYAKEPSYGYAVAGAVCPDSEEELKREANRFAKKKVHWHNVSGTRNEGQHRDLMTAHARSVGAEQMIVLDADEVWDTDSASNALDAATKHNKAGRWLARFHNFWQSFDWMVTDGFRPIRIVDLRHPLTVDEYLSEEDQPWGVFHFGYAQTRATMNYKFTCHSHNPEIRKSWLDEKFYPWKPGDEDLHPTAKNLWTAIPTPGPIAEKIKVILGDHPSFGIHPIR